MKYILAIDVKGCRQTDRQSIFYYLIFSFNLLIHFNSFLSVWTSTPHSIKSHLLLIMVIVHRISISWCFPNPAPLVLPNKVVTTTRRSGAGGWIMEIIIDSGPIINGNLLNTAAPRASSICCADPEKQFLELLQLGAQGAEIVGHKFKVTFKEH